MSDFVTTTVEGKVSTISDSGATDELAGITVDRADLFRTAVGRPIGIYLPTANGPVLGLARILRVEGTEATVEFTVDQIGEAQLMDLFAPLDWRAPLLTMFGAAVRGLVLRDQEGA